MTIDEAIKVVSAMDQKTEARFSEEERTAIITLGTAGWSGELQSDDPRLAELPEIIRDIVGVMKTKRIIQ
jgi:hypothetical protein